MQRMDEITAHRRVSEAVVRIRSTDEATLRDQTELSEIPAPPFGESMRAQAMAKRLGEAGLSNIRADAVGNVLAERNGSTDSAPLVLTAHLDTVFPEGTDVTVTRKGDTLSGPGISDDARGLAALLSVARALESCAITTQASLLFVATVGEEGSGDLRGVKHLFSAYGAAVGAGGFISLDGAGLNRIVVRGLGSRRYRITISGTGGHSWLDWGAPNPIHHLTELGRSLTEIGLEVEPQSTLTIARIGGGKSINAIPQEAWLEIDTRCADADVLERLGDHITHIANGVAAAEPALSVSRTVIGDRPSGITDPRTPLVRAAIDATRAIHRDPILALSSTDANVPMAAGIPAITIGCGGEAGLAHTTDEWYRNVHGPEGVIRALYTVLAAAGVTS